MLTNWTLAGLGLIFTFARMYGSRKKKDNFDLKFWIRDNWPELVQSTALLIALMMILVSDEAIIDIQPILDRWTGHSVVLPTKQVLSLLLGWGITEIIYFTNKKKKQWVENKQLNN